MNGSSRFRGILALGVSATALIVAAPAMAQATHPAKPPVVTSAAPGIGIAEVVVTAEKRSVNIQNVPVAVTAFTAKQRALEGINSIQDLTNFTPGLTYSSQLDRPVIRGLARSTNVYAADSSVGVYDNDLFTNSTFLVGRDDMIVDQVEVLLGPQNTLYGRNAIGGIINTQSKRPSEIFGGEVREEFGNYGSNKIEGTVTGPIPLVDGLTFRLSGIYDSQDDGYYKNLSGKEIGGIHHDPYVELQVQYKGERDDVWFMMYGLQFDGDRSGPGALQGSPGTGPYDTSLIDNNSTLFFNPNYAYSGGAVPGSVVGASPTGGNPTTLKNRRLDLSYDTDINVKNAYSFNFHWTHHFDGFDVKYVGGYSQYDYSLSLNNFLTGDSSIKSYQLPTYTLAQVPITSGNVCGYINAVGGACAPLTVDGNQGFNYDSKVKWYSQELNFASTGGGKFSWIAGLYYYNETDNNPETETATTQPQLTAAGFNVIPVSGATTYIPSLLGAAPPVGKSIFNPRQAGDYLFLDYQDMIQSTAGFGQVSYKITDTIKVTGGVRYTYDYKDAQEEARYLQLANKTFATLLGQNTPAIDITSVLVSYAPGKGIISGVSFPTTGKYAGDAIRKLGDSSSAVTGTAAIEWTPDRDTLAYARYNRGYKSLALNAGFVGANPEAAPESVNDYEVGLKKTINRNIQIDVAAFYYDYANDQLPLGFPVATPVGAENLTQFVNIPKAVSDGIELTAVWNPIAHLNLSLTYGFDHTEIQTGCSTFTTPLATATSGCFIDPADPLAQAKGAKPAGPATTTTEQGYTEVFQSVKGNALPQAPENKVAFNANYTMYFDPGNLTLSGTYVWKDHSYSSIFTRNQYDYAPSWSQVDLRATWSGNHDKYEVVVYVKNLFDTIGYDAAADGLYNATPQGGGAATYSPTYDLTPPRTFGAELHYKF
jgi:iron complex outermembrane receptor protein